MIEPEKDTEFEKGEWYFQTWEHVGYMKSIQGNNEYSMFVNENFKYGEGGFSWNFLDYKPDDVENYEPIYIYKHSVAEIIKQNEKQNQEMKAILKDFLTTFYQP